MLVMMVAKHPAELCPAFEPKYREMTVNWFENVGSLAAKYGIKFIDSYTDHPGHTNYALFDTPSMDAMMKFSMEPVIMAPLAYCKAKTFCVFDHAQTLENFKK